MKKILVGCILLISTASYSSADVLSTLEQLEAIGNRRNGYV